MSASAFSLSAAIPTDGFAVTTGEPVIGGLHGIHRHYFCPHCMSWMFTRPHGLDQLVNVRSTMLEQAPSLVPFIETCTNEKLPWATTPAVHSFGAFPPISGDHVTGLPVRPIGALDHAASEYRFTGFSDSSERYINREEGHLLKEQCKCYCTANRENGQCTDTVL